MKTYIQTINFPCNGIEVRISKQYTTCRVCFKLRTSVCIATQLKYAGGLEGMND